MMPERQQRSGACLYYGISVVISGRMLGLAKNSYC